MPLLQVQTIKDEIIEINYENPIDIGHGSFGSVSKCSLISPNIETIAIKRVLQDKRFKNRELQIMKSLDNENITKLHYYNYENEDNDQNSNNLYLNLFMEFLPTTLYKRNQFFTIKKQNMPLQEVKSYMFNILKGLEYLHSFQICHRDIKPQNILVDPHRQIAKICDFGSAKILSPSEQNVSYICSRYYRAPELIFGATNYTTKIDVWSTGCVFAELLIGQPLFPGESGIDQLVEIIKILGTPTHEDIISMNNNYTDHKFPIIKKIPLVKIFKNLNNPNDLIVLGFLEQFLLFNPNKRISARKAALNEWFD
ncbi:Cell division protein kinase [Wickerhamomyces ciferrii]|uniref:Cell division protein kinase n=1 Tax=Wickerhamomyces ciferrii (strain ATCC 14091 / BCRC 22168 / CBS 111 / JCM 3599 / NBRC 0793 / NRRL Y-1031 F-60-10) TaxID=1206466 RepID=K0KI34_WICCF|nr:Cell division protein kinase [Wickerhamomyces ciferrii]CCH40798.1 Cell division protein kinase [Wickerhamomyces ciferrii]